MKKNEWVQKPFEERVKWYRSKLSELKELLSADSTRQDQCEEILKKLKMRMVFDNTPSDDRSENGSEQDKLYHQTIYEAYKALPDFDTQRKDWERSIGQTNKLLSNWSS